MKNSAAGRDYPLSTSPMPPNENQGIKGIIESIRGNRAKNLEAKSYKEEAVAKRKEASAMKIKARKEGKAKIIEARAALVKAKKAM